MRFASCTVDGRRGVAVEKSGRWTAMFADDAGFPGSLADAVYAGSAALAALGDAIDRNGTKIHLNAANLLAPYVPERIFCVGLNYADHAAEANMTVPAHPTLFSRFGSSVIGPRDALRLPRVSSHFDFEGELAVVIGKGGRSIDRGAALAHVAAYSCFNDASVRDYQLRTTQWMLGKNFDGTGPFGPFLVTSDEVPSGGAGLAIETRLNGEVVQRSTTDQLIFDVAALIVDISAGIDHRPGDLIITGTPAGVGNAREPKLFMKDGDLCEVEIEALGTLANRVVADA